MDKVTGTTNVGLWSAAQVARKALSPEQTQARDGFTSSAPTLDGSYAQMRQLLSADSSKDAQAVAGMLSRIQSAADGESLPAVKQAQLQTGLLLASKMGDGITALAVTRAASSLLLASGTPAQMHAGIKALSELVRSSSLQMASNLSAPQVAVALSQAAEAPPASPLSAQLRGLNTYKSSYPSYEEYNVPPASYGSAQEIVDTLKGDPTKTRDVRANSHSLGTYLGTEAQKEGIVAQQVVDVLNSLRHFSSDPATLETQLRKGLNVKEERAKELAQLAPALEQFRNLKSFAEVGQSKDLTQAVTTLVESSHNWGPQPEDFRGCGEIVKKLLAGKDFNAFMDKEALNGKMEKKPPVGVILRNLGYPEGISNTLQEASMGVQAVDRLIFTPKNASDLVPIKNIATSPPPFPKQIADKIEPYAKDIQMAVKLNLGVANGLQSGQVKLDPQQMKAFGENRLRLAYLSAGELSGILAKEKTTSSGGRQEKIQHTIDQLQLKRQAIETYLGPDQVKDLDVSGKSPAEIRQMMRPLMQQSRDLFEAAVSQVAEGEPKDKILGWVKEFADFTSLKQPAA